MTMLTIKDMLRVLEIATHFSRIAVENLQLVSQSSEKLLTLVPKNSN